ncbi:hypothetical protein [Sphingomonas sp. GM_Shp_1]|uniref:hypothetical protein n=1 Tax=Sphingomonas sp. GM_Shp_1 TaxID=2937381 RepID=UPI00226B98E9|nr:hypothetical protein [Sphingomonas sp. GM_Shp_1]
MSDMAGDYAGNRPAFGNPRMLADQDRYMFWATGARVPSGVLVTAQADTRFVMTKLIFGSPQYAIDHLRLHYSGFACTEGGNSPQETVLPGNATVIYGVWIAVNGGEARACGFGGAAGTNIASGALGAWTDDLSVAVPPLAQVTVYTLYATAAGEKQIPVHQIMRQRGERVWGADNAAALIALIGTDTASTGSLEGTSFPAYYGPDFMVAKGWDGRPVPLVVCDSIGERQSDSVLAADMRRNMGWLRRWLDRDGPYGRIPHMMIGLPGAASKRELIATNSAKRWDIVDQVVAMNGGRRPFTCILNQMGRNDYESGSYATTRSNWKALNDRILARHPGTPIVAVGQVIHPNSTDGFRTLANQAYQAGGEWPNGVRYQLEADKQAGMDGTLAGYIDVARAVGLADTQGKWPEPFFVTTLAQQAGTDGTTTYDSIVLTDAPELGDVLQWIPGGAVDFASVIAITGQPGAWTCKLSYNGARTVVAAGGEVFAPNANDGSGTPRTGTHPRPRMIRAIAERVSQMDKGKLR